MAESLLLNGGSGFDNISVTAIPAKVRTGKKFLGNGSDEEQTGELNEVAAITYDLPLNGRQDIPAGIHNGDVTVSQTGIATMAGLTIYPRDYDQTINTKNKYVTSEIYIAALYGLEPGNIKKGVVIQLGNITIIGTFEGYL